jgi:predicted RNase H-like nuclease
MNLLGLDACKLGWCVIGNVNSSMVWGCFQNIHQVIETYPNTNRILIDIPIGLSSQNFSRTIDAEARKLLNKRKSSIFSPPCREALFETNYRSAHETNKRICGKGISIQAYNIGTKIIEIDEWIDVKENQLQVYEAHPELCFKSLNNNQDLEYSKHDKIGIELRKQIIFKDNKALENCFNDILKSYKRSQVKPDDILDAMALFLINNTSEKLTYVEDQNAIDETGKQVRIVYR